MSEPAAQTVARVIRLSKAGKTPAEIVAETGLTPGSIAQALRKLGHEGGGFDTLAHEHRIDGLEINPAGMSLERAMELANGATPRIRVVTGL